jgi:predicted nucleic acid-binding protein
MIVVDASVVVAALATERAHGPAAREVLLTVSQTLAAPALLDLEVVSALRRLETKPPAPTGLADAALGELASLRIERWPHEALLERVWQLRHNLTPYDASYVALAERLGATLVTADRAHLEVPGVGCDVRMLSA